jgi:type II secretory pathway pseudopilin PulG
MTRLFGFTLLEVLLVVAIMTTVLLPLFDLFSLQRRQVTSAGEEVAFHSYAIQRLAEEESRLNVLRFPPGVGKTRKEVRPPGSNRSIIETMSVTSVPDCTGLWRLTVELSWTSVLTSGANRELSLTKLVVDRSLATRLPIGNR